ncbi:hypothetical protein [Mesorhizobium mediterraneum]|uniref:hypothetical protein n=1 Tax=Mesorhizobium mediterraneum TaxID=43617 RepID=UPI0017801A1F|nr:hypothetical protein [Mesorhizobium mediterraneum]
MAGAKKKGLRSVLLNVVDDLDEVASLIDALDMGVGGGMLATERRNRAADTTRFANLANLPIASPCGGFALSSVDGA